MRQLRALRALRLNYSRCGVLLWLRRRGSSTGLRGWQLVLRFPEEVEAEHQAIAEGALG